VASERLEDIGTLAIDELNRSVTAANGQDLPSGGPCHSVYPVAVGWQLVLGESRRNIPNESVAVF
jgi:hypothetical protein